MMAMVFYGRNQCDTSNNSNASNVCIDSNSANSNTRSMGMV